MHFLDKWIGLTPEKLLERAYRQYSEASKMDRELEKRLRTEKAALKTLKTVQPAMLDPEGIAFKKSLFSSIIADTWSMMTGKIRLPVPFSLPLLTDPWTALGRSRLSDFQILRGGSEIVKLAEEMKNECGGLEPLVRNDLSGLQYLVQGIKIKHENSKQGKVADFANWFFRALFFRSQPKHIIATADSLINQIKKLLSESRPILSDGASKKTGECKSFSSDQEIGRDQLPISKPECANNKLESCVEEKRETFLRHIRGKSEKHIEKKEFFSALACIDLLPTEEKSVAFETLYDKIKNQNSVAPKRGCTKEEYNAVLHVRKFKKAAAILTELDTK